MSDSPDLATVLAEVGPRLRRLRTRRGVTLTQLAAETGISKSTLSRLETGQRKPSLELLLPLAQAHQVPARRARRRTRGRRPAHPAQAPAPQRPCRLPADPAVERRARVEGDHSARGGEPELRTHDGYEWLYVLSGHMRLILGEHDITMPPGEVAEFDTRLPHWFGPADDQPVEILSVHGSHGKRMHVRAAPRRKSDSA